MREFICGHASLAKCASDTMDLLFIGLVVAVIIVVAYKIVTDKDFWR